MPEAQINQSGPFRALYTNTNTINIPGPFYSNIRIFVLITVCSNLGKRLTHAVLLINFVVYFYVMPNLDLDSHYSLIIDNKYQNKVPQKYLNIFRFSRLYERISKYIRLSKNLQTNNQIYLYRGNGTNKNKNYI